MSKFKITYYTLCHHQNKVIRHSKTIKALDFHDAMNKFHQSGVYFEGILDCHEVFR